MVNMQERALLAQKTHLRVLIVEDDRTYRMIAYESMHNFGKYIIHKTLAENMEKAVEAFRDQQPDITLLDIHLPDGSGLELIDEFKEMNPSAYIVMMTGSADIDHVNEARRKGAQGYVLKPFNIQKIREVVAGYERKRQAGPKLGNQSAADSRRAKKQEKTLELAQQNDPASLQELLTRCRILVIDDYHSQCESTQRQIEKMGCKVDIAQSEDEAWKQTSKHRYQLFLVDTDLAGVSGYKLASKLMNDDDYDSASLPPYFVAMVNSQEEAASRKWARAGMNNCIVKPYSTQALQTLLTNFAQSYQQDIQMMS